MTEPTDRDKSPIDVAVETIVYAPIGLLFEGASLLPQLVEKGKNQVTMARMIGQFAVKKASGDAAKVAGRLQDQAAGILDFVAGSVAPVAPEPGPPPAPTEAGARADAEEPPAPPKRTGVAKEAARRVTTQADDTASAPKKAGAAKKAGASKQGGAAKKASAATASSARNEDAGEDAPVQATLAIPDYDGLSASQVVNRLAGLTPEELDAVRSYELATRGRKTILSKVAQLQSRA